MKRKHDNKWMNCPNSLPIDWYEKRSSAGDWMNLSFISKKMEAMKIATVEYQSVIKFLELRNVFNHFEGAIICVQRSTPLETKDLNVHVYYMKYPSQ